MKIFKVIGNTIASVGKTIEDSADLISTVVGDRGLKHTTKQSFRLINDSLDQSVIMAEVEAVEELKQFKLDHKITDADLSK